MTHDGTSPMQDPLHTMHTSQCPHVKIISWFCFTAYRFVMVCFICCFFSISPRKGMNCCTWSWRGACRRQRERERESKPSDWIIWFTKSALNRSCSIFHHASSWRLAQFLKDSEGKILPHFVQRHSYYDRFVSQESLRKHCFNISSTTLNFWICWPQHAGTARPAFIGKVAERGAGKEAEEDTGVGALPCGSQVFHGLPWLLYLFVLSLCLQICRTVAEHRRLFTKSEAEVKRSKHRRPSSSIETTWVQWDDMRQPALGCLRECRHMLTFVSGRLSQHM